MSGFERKPGGTSLVQRSAAAADPVSGPGKRTLTEQIAPAGVAPAHAAPAHQVAERNGLNAVITVVARGPDGAVIARWRGRGRWGGPLPVRYHGSRAAAAWTWSDPAARDTRLHTRADGTGGELVERWATAHGAATVDVVANAVDAASEDDEDPEAHDEPAAIGPSSASTGGAPGPGPANQEQIVAAFERELAAALDVQAGDEDRDGGEGAPGGDQHGRTGLDTALGGTGPGGPQARAGGDREGSETRGAVDGSRLGSSLGVEGGSEGGRYGGEGKRGDDGVRMAGAIAGGVITIPAALKGAVEIMLLADAGDITGAGANAFKALGKEAAGMGAAAVREFVAHEAREACRREIEAAVARMARSPKWLALSTEEQLRALRIVHYENMRRFFRGSRARPRTPSGQRPGPCAARPARARSQRRRASRSPRSAPRRPRSSRSRAGCRGTTGTRAASSHAISCHRSTGRLACGSSRRATRTSSPTR